MTNNEIEIVVQKAVDSIKTKNNNKISNILNSINLNSPQDYDMIIELFMNLIYDTVSDVVSQTLIEYNTKTNKN